MKENITKKNRATLLHPGWLIPITLIAGLTPSGPLAGAILLQCGHRKKGWVLGSILCLTGILILTAAALLSLEWYWVSIILITIHLISGIVLFFTLIGSYRKFMAKHNRPLSRLGSYREVITGAVAGAFLTGVLGAVFTIIYLLVIDRFFSTFMLVIFDDMFAIVKITILTCFLVLTGTLAGGFMGRFKPHISPGQMLPYTLALIWTHHTLFLALEITITIPGFQAMMATGAKLTPILLPFLLCGLIIGFWWAVFLLFFMVSPLTKTGKLSRALQVLFINLTAGITLSIYTGYPADMFLALGRYFERTALASQALQCYEQGLNKKPKDLIASYLQYHTAFLNHKQGNKEEAKDGFRRVVTKYTANKKLVKKSQRFLNRLNTTTAMEKRVVLPGIETRMDYIGASCAPNSLALVMRYWNINITARVIAQKVKGFSSGTSPITQAWFAKEHNLCHDFIPLAGITDIKQCLDAGLPVLVIVPQHIFAIFGYDERLGTFITFDTAVEENWVDYNQKDFIKTWKRTGAPLLLVYPREKEKLIPQNIRAKLMEADNNYLALWNYLYIKAATHSSPIPYLLLASGKTGEFFIPLVILYHDYPELRDSLRRQYNPDVVARAIKNYFWHDFDEGTHLAGQLHDKNKVKADRYFRLSMEYLIGEGQFDLVEDLVTRVKEQGPVSASILQYAGLIKIARGDFEQGLDLLSQRRVKSSLLYFSQVALKRKQNQRATRNLTGVLKNKLSKIKKPHNYFCDSKNSYKQFTLDKYGFPVIAITNNILIHKNDFGQSGKNLEENWASWIHHLPFDAPIAKALLKYYEKKKVDLNPLEDFEEYQHLENKINLIQGRIGRYDLKSFLTAD